MAALILLGASAESPRATADLAYFGDGDVSIYVGTSAGTPFFVNPCQAHLWLWSFAQGAPRERELRIAEQATCARPSPTRVDSQPEGLRVTLLDALRERGWLRLELRTDPGFATALDGTPISVSSHRFAGAVWLYNPTLPPAESARPYVDADAAVLMRRYGHRPLWTYGDRLFSCYDDNGNAAGPITTIDHAPVVLTSVARVPRMEKWMALGTHEFASCYGNCGPTSVGYLYVARDPLRLSFALPHGAYRRTVRGGTTGGELAGWLSHQCRYAQTYVADPWDFERQFTTIDPRQPRIGWSPALQQQMLNFQAAPGMTPEMTAFALGFPSTFGSAAALLHQTRWRWYPGDEETTAIFYNGRLVRISPRDRFDFSSDVY